MKMMAQADCVVADHFIGDDYSLHAHHPRPITTIIDLRRQFSPVCGYPIYLIRLIGYAELKVRRQLVRMRMPISLIRLIGYAELKVRRQLVRLRMPTKD